MTREQPTRNISLDILRILACVGVIAIHTAGSVAQHGWTQIGTLQWHICESIDSISRWSVPVFAMLTGYIFLNPHKSLPISKLFGKYISRIVVALVFWSFFYSFMMHVPFYPFGTQEGHFWYLGMCVGLYMALPILRCISVNKALLAYFCWIWLGSKVYFFIGNFCTLPIDIPYLMYTDYVGYCMWAYYLSLQSRTKNLDVLMWTEVVVCLMITLLAKIISRNSDTFFCGYNSITTIGASLGLFYIFSHWNFKCSESVGRMIQYLAECTFGIYLIHMWLLIEFFFRVHTYISTPIIVVIVCIIAVFVVGLLITTIVKHVPILRRWVV